MAPTGVSATSWPRDDWVHWHTPAPPPSSTAISVASSASCSTSAASAQHSNAGSTSGHQRVTSLSDLASRTSAASTSTVYISIKHSDGGGSSVSGGARSSTSSTASIRGPPLVQNGPRPSSSLSLAHERAVIACSVIGGVFLLALIFFILWRRRQRQQQQTVHPLLETERPPSRTTLLTTKTRDSNLTALPIRSARRKSIPVLGDSLAQHRPVGQNLWKSANPPTPTHPTFARRSIRNTALRPHPKLPEMAMLAGAGTGAPREDRFFLPAESIHAPSTIDLNRRSRADTRESSQAPTRTRWSMATSGLSGKSRLSSIRGLRAAQTWIGGSFYRARRLSGNASGRIGPSESNLKGVLKNKATKPNLAPVPTQELPRRTARKVGPSALSHVRSVGAAAIPDDGVVS